MIYRIHTKRRERKFLDQEVIDAAEEYIREFDHPLRDSIKLSHNLDWLRQAVRERKEFGR